MTIDIEGILNKLYVLLPIIYLLTVAIKGRSAVYIASNDFYKY